MANVLERVLRVGEGRTLRRLKNYAEAINHLEEHFEDLSDEELRDETTQFRERYADAEDPLQDVRHEVSLREAGTRTARRYRRVTLASVVAGLPGRPATTFR